MESSQAAAARVALQDDGKRTLSPEEPAVTTLPVPLCDVVASARFNGGVVDHPHPRTSDSDDGDAVLNGEDEELAGEPLSGDEDEELDDIDDSNSDNDDSEIEFEEDDDEAAGSNDDLILAPVEFLGGPARFATVESTAGFMLLDAAEADQDGGGEITVHYRYVRFSGEQSAGPGVDVHNGAKLHPVRFLVPSHAAAADTASSLRLAGAALADMVYPPRFNAQLQELWLNLVAAAPVRVPPHATRVQVTVSVGILRRGDRTPQRMASMLAALAGMARDANAWTLLRHVGMVMHLPAPVSCVEGSEDNDGAQPAKRRRIAVEEKECAICYEVMERGLAAWPRCSHVFHGGCLEQLLVRGDQRCPLCRSELKGKAPG